MAASKSRYAGVLQMSPTDGANLMAYSSVATDHLSLKLMEGKP